MLGAVRTVRAVRAVGAVRPIGTVGAVMLVRTVRPIGACRAYKGSKDGWIAPIAQIAPIDGFRTNGLTNGRVGFCVVGQPKRKVEIFSASFIYPWAYFFVV